MRDRSPLKYFLLVFALSVPFALLGSVSGLQLMPGIPISALGFVCPVTAAAILVWRDDGAAGVAALLRRSVDYHRSRDKIWFLPVLLLMPVVTALAYGIMRLARQPLAIPHFSMLGTPLLLLVFFIAALGEELGWSGYAIDPLQARYGPVLAAVILGIVWAAWHIVAMVQAGQSPGWIAWGCLDMVATRILMVWVYNNAGKSVFVVTLYHAVANISTKSIFPGGSYPGERIISLVLAILAATVALSWTSRRVREPG